MKSQAQNMIITTFAALLRDAAAVMGSPLEAVIDWRGHSVPACWRHDLRHLDAILERWDTLNVFSIVLPNLGKYLDGSLANGQLLSNRPPLAGALNKRSSSPAFLHALWKSIFTDEGELRSDADVEHIAMLRQLLYFAKKVKVECADEKRNDALTEFLSIDRSLLPPLPGTWNSSSPTWMPRKGHPLYGGRIPESPSFTGGDSMSSSGVPWEYFRGVCRLMSSRIPEFDIWSLRPKHGPGAVSEDVSFKHDFRAWSRRLEKVFPSDWFASSDLQSRTTDYRDHPSRVLCVPKTQKGPRIIAAEPSANQYMQGALERFLSDAIRSTSLSHCIDLRNQTLSRNAALEGSITGLTATVDLSAASDRISARLIDYLFQGRDEILDALWACRSMRFTMPDGTTHLANKFACMGSACTFPIQSILFSTIAITSVMWEQADRLSYESFGGAARQVRVFGDDIVIPVSAYATMSSLLTDCGLKINVDKTYASGYFRESCGLDAYEGVDVTPAYLSRTFVEENPESLVSVVETSNNFHKKGYWYTAAAVLKTVPRRFLSGLYYGHRDVGVISVFSYVDGYRPPLSRWNDSLHRFENAALSLFSKARRLGDDGKSLLYQYLADSEFRRSEPTWLDSVFPVERQVGLQGRPTHRLRRRWETLT